MNDCKSGNSVIFGSNCWIHTLFSFYNPMDIIYVLISYPVKNTLWTNCVYPLMCKFYCYKSLQMSIVFYLGSLKFRSLENHDHRFDLNINFMPISCWHGKHVYTSQILASGLFGVRIEDGGEGRHFYQLEIFWSSRESLYAWLFVSKLRMYYILRHHSNYWLCLIHNTIALLIIC